MTSIKLMLNRDRILNSGKFPLVFQIIHRRKRRLIYTNYKLYHEEFDPETQKLVYHPRDGGYLKSEINKLNAHLNHELRRLKKVIKELDQTQSEYTVVDVCEKYGSHIPKYKLLYYLDQCITEKENQGKYGIAAAYKSTRSSLNIFLSGRDIGFRDVTLRFVREYEDFLKRKHLTDNTIAFYMRNFRTIYNRFVDDGFTTGNSNPFKSVKMSPAQTVKRALTKCDLRSLVKMKFDSSEYELELSRDLFLFSFYTRGMTFVDIIYLKYVDIVNDTLVYRRQKTGQVLGVGVTPQLKAIIKKYYFEDREYVMPILNSHSPDLLYRQYRIALSRNVRHLRVIGERLKLSVKLTSYSARHSWATLAKKSGANMSVISEGLGHTSEKTTRIYLKNLDGAVLDQLNKNVIDL